MAHAVALLPGFLGFDHRGDRTYFADRFIAGLRARLEARCKQSIDVVPVSTLPIGSLASRQVELIKEIGKLDKKLGGRTWHLIGHSTGGVDAVALSCAKKLTYDKARGSVFGNEALDAPWLASVTTLSAPLWGTALALSPVAQLTQGKDVWKGALALLKVAPDLMQRDDMQARAEFLLGAASASGPTSLLHMMLNNELAKDLQPAVSGALMQAATLRTGIARFSLATLVPPPTGDLPDHFFRDLWTWTSKEGGADPRPPAFPELKTLRIIASDPRRVPAVIAPSANDGVVNTDRQIIGKPLALVFGDHGDVMGRYKRIDLHDDSTIDPGLLTSGADFRDAQFFEFLGALSEGIAETIGT